MVENWRDIKGYEGIYQVSDLGNVKSLSRTIIRNGNVSNLNERILKAGKNGKGRLMVGLYKDEKMTMHYVHNLVIETFVEATRPKGYEICHNDGNHLNNCLSNLRYDTQSQNQIDMYRYGGMGANGKLSIEKVLNIRELYKSGDYTQTKIAKMFDISVASVSNIINRKKYGWLNDDGSIDESSTKVS